MGYFAKEGYPWVFVAVFITVASYINTINPNHPKFFYIIFWTVPMICVTVFFIFFFRDPKREFPENYIPGVSIICPADGTLRSVVKEGDDLAFFIEMHGQNVHICRSHISGKVLSVTRTKGKHKPVYYLKKKKKKRSQAIRKNGRATLEIEDDRSRIITYQLICGRLARRAKPYVQPGDYLKEGERIGIIMFGSLVKITLPGHNYKLNLEIGTQVKAKKMVLCERIEENQNKKQIDEQKYLAESISETFVHNINVPSTEPSQDIENSKSKDKLK